jgi:histidine triad (HIT) family protein
MSSIFDKIIDREIPADIIYETEICLAFRDINPQAPEHILIIPKKPIVKLSEAKPEDAQLMGQLLLAVGEVARILKVDEEGFRVVINNGENAGQTVFHLHLHLLAGRGFSWPPG